MKRLYICGALVLAMVITGLSLFVYTERTADELTEKLERIRKFSDEGNFDAAYETATDVSRSWEDFCIYNIFMTDRECALEISDTVIRIEALAAEKDKALAEECRTAGGLIEYYRRSQRPLPENIF